MPFITQTHWSETYDLEVKTIGTLMIGLEENVIRVVDGYYGQSVSNPIMRTINTIKAYGYGWFMLFIDSIDSIVYIEF